MRTVESYFEQLSTEELGKAFEEYEQWRITGVLMDGVLRNTFNAFMTENAWSIGIHSMVEPFLYVYVTRLRDIE